MTWGMKRFSRNETGNVAMIAALAILPILTIAGFAIDFQMTTTRKAKVQAAVDSAVLAATKSMQDGKSRDHVISEANIYFKAILNQNESSGLACSPLAITYIEDADELEGNVNCYQRTTLSQVAGYERLDFYVSSAATYGIGKLEIAFVFDVSGSMGSSSRMDNLKVAAREAVDVLLPEEGYPGDPEDIRLAMVSYDTMVNAGPYFEAVTNVAPTRTYNHSSWRYQCVRYRGNSGNCREYDWVEVTSSFTLNSTCVWEREGTDRYTGAGPGNGRWITPLSASYDPGRDRWSADSPSSPYCNTDTPVPLTYDRDDLIDFIDAMRPRGMTAGHIGTAWGWYLISPDWNHVWPSGSKALPYDEPDATKVMIMMSDGEYNQVRPGSGNPNSATQARAICDEMKDTGIIIYSVGFNAPSRGQAVLDHCASSPGHSFRPKTGQELTDAYKNIARDISDLRISR